MWWQRLPDSMRQYLLYTVTDDDWGRWADCTWDALPDGLRSAIASECRALVRVASGCPWR